MIRGFVEMIKGFVFSCTILVLIHQGVKPSSFDARGSICVWLSCVDHEIHCPVKRRRVSE